MNVFEGGIYVKGIIYFLLKYYIYKNMILFYI